MPATDGGFIKQAETYSTFWTIKIFCENTVVTESTFVCLSVHLWKTEECLW